MHACIHTYTHAHNFYVYMHVILYKNTHTHLYAWPVLPVHRHTFLMYWGNWQVCCMLTNHTMNNKLLQYYKLNLTVWHPCEAHILLLSLTTPPGGITAESTFRGRGVACIAPMSWCSTLHTRVLQLLPPNSFPYDVLTAEVSAVISNDCFREEEEDEEGVWGTMIVFTCGRPVFFVRLVPFLSFGSCSSPYCCCCCCRWQNQQPVSYGILTREIVWIEHGVIISANPLH